MQDGFVSCSLIIGRVIFHSEILDVDSVFVESKVGIPDALIVAIVYHNRGLIGVLNVETIEKGGDFSFSVGLEHFSK